MCGIAGWFNGRDSGASEPGRLKSMCDAIVHRGPDDEGGWIGTHAALGMRRLSIVDLEGGRQPMQTPDARWWIVFNGEIYNHAALRAELKNSGAEFRTTSDTEVLLVLLAREGLAGLHKLNGMFGIALWDEREKKLSLIRDRMGVKPLYYFWDGTRLVFGSEIKAILAGLDNKPQVNERAIWDYLTLRYVPTPETIWRGVQKLPAGCYLQISVDRPNPVVTSWWTVPRSGREPDNDAVLQRDFDSLLTDAVDLRMLADVPVGITLSGGLDSSFVAAKAARNGARVKTFSVAFDGAPELDERPYARAVAKAIGAEHREIVVDARMFQDFIPDFVYHTDEPLADLASIPLHYVCKLAREDVKVVLSGEGADEILGGYSFDYWAKRWDEAAALSRPRFFGAATARAADPQDLDLRLAAEPISMTNYLSGAEKRAMLRFVSAMPDTLDRPRAALADFGNASPLAQALFLYCQDWLVEDLLMKADKMSMATSLELRTPFLDYRVVEYAATLPDRWRAGMGKSGKYETKRILRDLARTMLPPQITERPKMGFPVPVYAWLSGPLLPLAHDLISANDARLRSWIEPAALAASVDAGVRTDAQTMDQHKLWNLMILEAWLRRWT